MSTFSYVPLGDNIVVRADEKEKESAGGIILPDAGGEAVTQGTVVAVPEDMEVLQAGDRVQYNQFGGVEYEIEGEKLLVMTIHDVVLREVR